MEETISLKEIFGVIKKRLLLIIAFVFGAALIAAVISYFVLTPTYQSSSQFIVNQEQQDPNAQYNVNDIRTNVEIIKTYNIIIKSAAILNEVVAELDLPYSAGVLSEKIQVSSQDSSQVVSVTATDENPQQAVQIANATVGIFQDKIPDLMNVDNVRVLTEAEMSPTPSPVAPNPILNIAIAIVLGGMVGVGIAFLLEYLDNSITTEDDVDKKLGLPVLGVISHINNDDVRGDHFTFQPTRAKRSGFDGAQKESI
ncbi:capsular biosynthesis protein [Virgibacillus profundi]|uniref:Capsular biosynthesis protein n=1 Tax=Virgibacillus profundi TaxID=2024555 RepID=A0A2A2IHT5_9BACI|nr:Wzz/FepE/Etk N-terminal domain-containing protein [Virgibacillus profundi]PAV31102.1 capsular biosynthesis protein [Virgibacillus profundi]PXY55285.1 capsular biosynthesis protein [Virgibacillus profundi]